VQTHMCTVEQGANMMKPLSRVYRSSKFFCRRSFDMVPIDLVPCVYSLWTNLVADTVCPPSSCLCSMKPALDKIPWRYYFKYVHNLIFKNPLQKGLRTVGYFYLLKLDSWNRWDWKSSFNHILEKRTASIFLADPGK